MLMLLATAPLSAQEGLTVESFEENLTDPTASDLNKFNKVKDKNNVYPALVKVLMAAEDATFEGYYVPDGTKSPLASEYWVWMNADSPNFENGAPDLKISVPGFEPLIVNFSDYGIKKIESKHTYILKIKVPVKRKPLDPTKPKRFTIKVTPTDAELSVDDVKRTLVNGEWTNELASGTHDYRVTANYYRPVAGSFDVGEDMKSNTLTINLEKEMGRLQVRGEPYDAKIYVDNKQVDRSSPIDLQAGPHKVKVTADGYKTIEDDIVISDGQTRDYQYNLTRTATFKFTTKPTGAEISINGVSIGKTGNKPIEKEYTTGDYVVKIEKAGYKYLDNGKKYHLDSSKPEVSFSLSKIYNYKNEFYFEPNFRLGTFTAYGGTVGGYFNNINAEASFLMGSGTSETIYWSGNDTPPVACTYKPSTNFALRLGYGIPLATRFRLTPQAGINILKLKETVEGNSNSTPADGANTMMGVVALRFTAAIIDHLAVSVAPEFAFSASKSKGFEALSDVSSDIKKWGEGFNVKLGLTVFF